LKRLQDWAARPGPAGQRIGSQGHRVRRGEGPTSRDRLADLLPVQQAEVTATWSASPGRPIRATAAWALVRADGAHPHRPPTASRTSPADVKRRFAIILDEKVESAAGHPEQDPRASHDHHGSGSLDQQLQDARSWSWCPRPAAAGRHLGSPTSSGSARRSAATRSARASRTRRRRDPRADLHGVYYAAPASSPTWPSSSTWCCRCAYPGDVRRLDDTPRHGGPGAHHGHRSTPTCSSTSASARSCRLGKTRARRSTSAYDKAFSAILDGHVTTSRRPYPGQYGTGPIKGFAVTLMIRHRGQHVHRRGVHPDPVRLGRRHRKVKKLSVGIQDAGFHLRAQPPLELREEAWNSSSLAGSSTSWQAPVLIGFSCCCSSVDRLVHQARTEARDGL